MICVTGVSRARVASLNSDLVRTLTRRGTVLRAQTVQAPDQGESHGRGWSIVPNPTLTRNNSVVQKTQ
jgi:hypothetical protein